MNALKQSILLANDQYLSYEHGKNLYDVEMPDSKLQTCAFLSRFKKIATSRPNFISAKNFTAPN